MPLVESMSLGPGWEGVALARGIGSVHRGYWWPLHIHPSPWREGHDRGTSYSAALNLFRQVG